MQRERLLSGENDSDHDWRALARQAGVPEWEASELYRQAAERAAEEPWRVRAAYLELLDQARSQEATASSGVSPGKQTLSAGIGQPSRRGSRAAPGKGSTRMTTPATSSATPAASPAAATVPGIPVLRRARSAPAEPGGTVLEQVLACEGGEPLPEPLRRRLEARFGVDLGGVRIHTDHEAAAAAMAASARAFAVGEHLFFGRGEFAPEQDSGFELLAHEIAHVVQYYQGRVQHDATPGLSRPGDPLEREAEQVSRSVAAAEHVSTRSELPAARAMAAEGRDGADPIHAAGSQVIPDAPVRLPGHSGGTEMPRDVQARMEAAFGVDPVIHGHIGAKPVGRLPAAGANVGIILRAADESAQPAASNRSGVPLRVR